MQERLDSSGRGKSEYANHKDDQDGPAPPHSGTPDSESDPGARLRRALSRNTMLPQDVPSAAGSKTGAASKSNNASQGMVNGSTSLPESANCVRSCCASGPRSGALLYLALEWNTGIAWLACRAGDMRDGL